MDNLFQPFYNTYTFSRSLNTMVSYLPICFLKIDQNLYKVKIIRIVNINLDVFSIKNYQ